MFMFGSQEYRGKDKKMAVRMGCLQNGFGTVFVQYLSRTAEAPTRPIKQMPFILKRVLLLSLCAVNLSGIFFNNNNNNHRSNSRS